MGTGPMNSSPQQVHGDKRRQLLVGMAGTEQTVATGGRSWTGDWLAERWSCGLTGVGTDGSALVAVIGATAAIAGAITACPAVEKTGPARWQARGLASHRPVS